MSLQWTDPADSLNLVDLSNGFQPLDVLPLLTGVLPSAYYLQERTYCGDTECSTLATSMTFFTLSTLALFAVGLLGSGLARRRQLG